MHVKKNTSTIPLFPEVCFSPQTATSQSPCWSAVVPMDFSQMHKVFASSQDPREACDRNPNQAIARGGSLAEFESYFRLTFCQWGMFRSDSFHSRIPPSRSLTCWLIVLGSVMKLWGSDDRFLWATGSQRCTDHVQWRPWKRPCQCGGEAGEQVGTTGRSSRPWCDPRSQWDLQGAKSALLQGRYTESSQLI